MNTPVKRIVIRASLAGWRWFWAGLAETERRGLVADLKVQS